jgi:predicted AAA+ superfamily ATPase
MIDLRRGVDRMPGREGHGQDLQLLPMSFDEYLLAKKDAGLTLSGRSTELSHYFKVGGFPIAVAESFGHKNKMAKSESVVEKWILGDIARLGKNEIYAKEIMAQIALTLTSQMSTQKLAQRTQVGSHHTVQDYLQILSDMFIVSTLYSIDQNTGASRLKKEKKFYLNDPIYIKLALSWIGLDESHLDESIFAETMAHEYLRHKHPRFGFLSSAKGGEVDFYAFKKWAIEVKWSEGLNNLSSTYKNLILKNKLVWNKDNFFADF